MAVSKGELSDLLSKSLTTNGSDEEPSAYCTPCDKGGQRLPIHGSCVDCDKHLCYNCSTSYKQHSLSRNHTLLDSENAPTNSSYQFPATAESFQQNDLTESCSKHKSEMIKFYCQDHKALVCSVCVALGHPPLICKVSYIPEISQNIVNSQEYQTIVEKVHIISDNFLEMKEHTTTTIAKSNRSLAGVLDDIKKFRKEVNKRLDELEKKVEDAAKGIAKENNKYLKKVESTCFDVTSYLETVSKSIQQLNTSKQAEKLFIQLIHAKNAVKENEIKLEALANYNIKQYSFKPNEAIRTLLGKETDLGALLTTTLQMKSRKVTKQRSLCIQTLRDKQTCLITGMTIVSQEHLAVVDNKNMAIKLVNSNSHRMIAHLKLKIEPWDITKISNMELAVTLPNQHKIQFLSVFPSSQLKLKHHIKADGPCYGISCSQGKIIVLFCKPTKLQIIDIDDTVLTTVGGGSTFFSPMYATANRSSIYVADKKIKKLIKLDWQGNAVGSYGDMLDPSKVALSHDGTVFVCDGQRNVIEEVLEDCSRGKIVMKDLPGPRAICWCSETNRMYVSCCTKGGKYDNFVQIYEFS